MSATKEQPKRQTISNNLESLIEKALKKVNGTSENDICRYLPMNGGYMHHFTLRKMKTEVPEELSTMIKKFITEASQPERVPAKPRAARGSRKRSDNVVLSDEDMKRLLNIARLANDQEMIRKLTPKKSLPSVRRDLTASIRQGKVRHELWNEYVEAVNSQSSFLESDSQQSESLSSSAWHTLPGLN